MREFPAARQSECGWCGRHAWAFGEAPFSCGRCRARWDGKGRYWFRGGDTVAGDEVWVEAPEGKLVVQLEIEE